MVRQVNRLTDAMKQEAESTNNFKEEAISVLNITNQRIDTLRKDQRHLSEEVGRVTLRIQEWQKQFKRTRSAILLLAKVPLHIGSLVRILATDLLVVLELEEAAQHYLTGIQALSEGYLPLTLVTPRILSHTLQDTAAKLHLSYPGHKIRFKQTYHYYREPTVVTINSGDNLYIQLTIPIDNLQPILHVYKVYSTALPFPNGTGATTILGLPQYFAGHSSNDWYQQLSHTDLESCTGTIYKDCPRTFALRNKKYPSCISALYFREAEEIRKHCKTGYMPYHTFEDNIKDLGSGRVLISNVNRRMSLVCPQSVAKPLPDCPLCLINLPCSCSVQADTTYLASSLRTCKNVDGESKVFHPINVIAIAELSRKSFEGQRDVVTQDQTESDDAWRFNGSNIPFYKSSFGNGDAIAWEVTIGLKTLSRQLNNKKGHEYFLSHVDYLDSVLSSMPKYLSRTVGLIALTVIAVLALCSIVLSVRLYYKYRYLLSMISIIAVPSATDAAHPSLLWKGESLKQGYPILQTWYSYIVIILMVILFIHAMYFLINVIRYLARNSILFSPFSAIVRSVMSSKTCHLGLKLQKEYDSVILSVKRLQMPPHQVQLTSGLNIRSLRIESDCFRVRLCLDWGTTLITLKSVNTSLHLPVTVPIPRLLTKRVMDLIHSSHTCELCIIRENVFYLIPMSTAALQ